MSGKGATPDRLVAEIAEKQHGVMCVEQLRRCGVSDDAIRARALAGRLHRVHQGVYAIGHLVLSPRGRCLAAVLAVRRRASGDSTAAEALTRPVLDHWGAAVSHRSAASLWELLPATDGPVDVIVRGLGGKRKRRGLRIHRSRFLLPSHVTLRDGIPLTTPARTIADLRMAIALARPGAVSPRELRRAVRQANVLGLSIGEESGRDRTRSDLERDFLGLCRRHRLPRPEINIRVGRHLVDFLWHDRRLVVETDSYLYHRGKAAFQDDRERDLDLRKRGYEVLRLSEKQIDEEPARVAEVLAAVLECQAAAERPHRVGG